ncbi:MAG TPA: acyl-CoA dehydrogenase family protein [Burkholderiaceae bacterium]
MHNELETAFGQLLAERCSPAVVRAIERETERATERARGPRAAADALWSTLADSGFADALVPEAQGGAGLTLADVLPLVQACGRHAMPLPFAETMSARGVLAHAGRSWPAGPITLAAVDGVVEPDARLALHAALCAAQIAGAVERVLEMSLEHAKQRVQFGKPVGSFQAVQHQLSAMAEQACAARIAAQLCFASDTHLPDRRLAAIAMVAAGEAAEVVAAGGHAVHGAIGISAEFDLQLYTRRLREWRVEAGSPAYWSRQVGRAWWSGPQALGAVDFALDSLAAARF